MNTNKIPIDIIIASFRGEISPEQSKSLKEWISSEGNAEKYEGLKRVWDQTVSGAAKFDSRKGYGRFRSRVSRIWKHIAVAASVAAVIAIVFVFICLSIPKTSVPDIQEYTCLSGKSRIVLPDGSQITLNKGATISYGESFDRTNRIVCLDGEAYFDVASDPNNTFIINVDDIDVIVYGTAFNVREDNESITVSLIEGALDVKTEGSILCSLIPGHSAVYDKAAGSLVEGKSDVTFSSCWAKDKLTFTQSSLSEVCRYMSKWYGVEIILPESLKSSSSYTFTIHDESIEQILGIMSRINPMNYIYTNDNRIIISETL